MGYNRLMEKHTEGQTEGQAGDKITDGKTARYIMHGERETHTDRNTYIWRQTDRDVMDTYRPMNKRDILNDRDMIGDRQKDRKGDGQRDGQTDWQGDD